MEIKELNVTMRGYVTCQSTFYRVMDSIDQCAYTFNVGINKLVGDIDSGIWSTSYLLSMYKCKPKEFALFEEPKITVNGNAVAIEEILKYSCYLDRDYPLFKSKKTIRRLITEGIKSSGIDKNAEEIRDMFHIDAERFERPIKETGNTRYKAMAAIGYAHNKQIYCFPWFSQKRFDAFHAHMTDLLEVLASLNMVVILPIGKE